MLILNILIGCSKIFFIQSGHEILVWDYLWLYSTSYNFTNADTFADFESVEFESDDSDVDSEPDDVQMSISMATEIVTAELSVASVQNVVKHVRWVTS